MLKVFHVDFVGNWIVLMVLMCLTAFVPTILLFPVLYFVLNTVLVRHEVEEKDYDGLRAACKAQRSESPMAWGDPPKF